MAQKSLFPLRLALTASALSLPLTAIFAAPLQSEQIVDPSSLTAEAELLIAPIPDWVEVAEIPSEQTDATRGLAASTAVHSDQYMITQKGGIAYQRMVYRISDRSALEDYGTMSIEWEPSRSKATLHRFNIIRDGQIIDVVQKQGDFSLFRREPNLSEGILDGQVTASMQIQDLRVGDLIEFAFSIETSYAPMTGHYQNWHYFTGRNQADRMVQRVVWPKDRYLKVVKGEGLPDMPVQIKGKYKVQGFTQDAVDWEAMPEKLLGRYYRERAYEISTFRDWDEMAQAFRPVYEKAVKVPASGPLRDYIEQVRAKNLSPRQIVETVLAMVQTDIRYVGNFQGLGNYTPASAESVWASKFGDCKGKTILLTAILRELGLDATPSLVNTGGNDKLEDAIAMPGWFNHVFVRLRMDGKTYWLDGTRLGDNNLDLLPPVFYDYTLPLEADSDLVEITDNHYAQPQVTSDMIIDARAGFETDANVTMKIIYHGDSALSVIQGLEEKSEAERERAIQELLDKESEDDIAFKSLEFIVDKPKKQAGFLLTGEMKVDWGEASDFREFLLDEMTIGEDFFAERDDDDYKQALLWANPSHVSINVELLLPEDSGQIEITGKEYDEKIGMAHYKRSLNLKDNVVTAYTSTNIERGSYLPIAAKIWDNKSDKLFDDKVYINIFGSGTAAKRVANYDSNIERADTLAAGGDVKAAAGILNPLLASDPNNVKLLIARGRIGDDPALRERDLLRALLLQPRNMEALKAMAEVYLGQDNVSLGKTMLERMLAREEDNIWAKKQMEVVNGKSLAD